MGTRVIVRVNALTPRREACFGCPSFLVSADGDAVVVTHVGAVVAAGGTGGVAEDGAGGANLVFLLHEEEDSLPEHIQYKT